ncbi:putative origin recognition complex subunit 2 [Zalerion maritima]|uniref:Origin recognition complex subunit 2 n=1 Tax=Zalerion maritima TaxID=339359 RepID=A0AAD5S3R7_9PEZI|nr:putative origin recognition complex subunit 2 [Zalerion maritima]
MATMKRKKNQEDREVGTPQSSTPTPRKRARKAAGAVASRVAGAAELSLDEQASPSRRPGARSRRTAPKGIALNGHTNGHETPDENESTEDDEADETPSSTPRPRRRALPTSRAPLSTTKSKSNLRGINGTPAKTTPSASRHAKKLVEFETPSRPAGPTPSRRIAADRSARRKSARAMIARVVVGGDSDEDGGEDALNRVIYESSDDEGEAEEVGVADEEPTPKPQPTTKPEAQPSATAAKMSTEEATQSEDVAPADPALTPKRGRGRPKGTGKLQLERARLAAGRPRNRSPTPPANMPEQERYFLTNKPGYGAKTSNNTLSSLDLLTHDEYFTLMHTMKDRHEMEIERLSEKLEECFPQWLFEMQEGFSVCLYGYGSKRKLLERFAGYVYEHYRDRSQHQYGGDDEEVAQGTEGPTPISSSPERKRKRKSRSGGGVVGGVVAIPSSPNEANTTTTQDLAVRTSPEHKIVIINGYLPTLSPRDILAPISHASNPSSKLPSSTPAAMLSSLLSTLSSSPVRITLVIHSIDSPSLRPSKTQSMLSHLSSHPGIQLVCSVSTPSFPFLWDASLRSSYNFLFHAATTFAPYGPPEINPVDDAHELLGRTNRRVGGKDGVIFVLKSLPENAKNLFRILVLEVLAGMDEEDGEGGGGGGYGARGDAGGVEYRMLFRKAEEEFVCSNDVGFRTLLKEFHDHQIITSRMDMSGTEILCLPFRKEELEGILEDLMS